MPIINIIGAFASFVGCFVSVVGLFLAVYFFFCGIEENKKITEMNRQITQKIEISKELSPDVWKYRFKEWLYKARGYNPPYIRLKKDKYLLTPVGLKLIEGDLDLEDKIDEVLRDLKSNRNSQRSDEKKEDKVRLLLDRLGIQYLFDKAREKKVGEIRIFLAVIAIFADECRLF